MKLNICDPVLSVYILEQDSGLSDRRGKSDSNKSINIVLILSNLIF